MDFTWMEILAIDYILDLKKEKKFNSFTDNGVTYCKIAFQPSADDYWVLGSGFYEGYYVVHEPISDLNSSGS